MHRHVLVTGLMGSGKSTFLLEYMLNFKTIEFTKPQVEAKFQGQEFEFIDNVFAISRNDVIYNFYELDAPTIKKWTQFVSFANGITVVSNQNQKRQFSTPESLMETIITHAPKTPILFVANNYDDFEEAAANIRKHYQLDRLKHSNYDIIGIGKGEKYIDDVYGVRFKLDNDNLKKAVEWHLLRESI